MLFRSKLEKYTEKTEIELRKYVEALYLDELKHHIVVDPQEKCISKYDEYDDIRIRVLLNKHGEVAQIKFESYHDINNRTSLEKLYRSRSSIDALVKFLNDKDKYLSYIVATIEWRNKNTESAFNKNRDIVEKFNLDAEQIK